MRGIFYKSIPTIQLYTQCIFSVFFFHIANIILVCDPLSNSPFSWVFHNSTPKIFSIVLGEGGGGEGGCREPRNESSSQLYQLLYVSLRNLKRNNKEENLKGIFRKSIPTKQLYTQCLFSFFFLFFFFFHFLSFFSGHTKDVIACHDAGNPINSLLLQW